MPTYTVTFDDPSEVPPLVTEAPYLDALADPIVRHAREHLTSSIDGVSLHNTTAGEESGVGLVLAGLDEPAHFTITSEGDV